jgi:uncharacterized protein
VKETLVPPIGPSEGKAAGLEQESGPRGGATVAPPQPKAAAQRSRWTAGRITALGIGSLLVLIALVMLGAGGTALWADLTKRDGGYVTTDVHHFSTSGSALVTERTELGAAGFGWLYSPGILGKVRIRVTPVSSGPPVFVGIGPSADVDRYLSGVKRTVISDFRKDTVEAVGGGLPRSPPGQQDFWVASASGLGEQSLVWDPADGSWAAVVMNADGRAAVDIAADLGATVPALAWIAIGVLLAGAIFLAGGALLIVGALARGGTSPSEGGVMAASITATAPHAVAGRAEDVDRYKAIKQYSVAQTLGVWAAAARLDRDRRPQRPERVLRGDHPDARHVRRGTMQTIKQAASEFLNKKRVAVTGVSRTPKSHGSNTVYRRLRDRGYEVFAVNPNAAEVEGDRSYPDLKSIPGGVEAVVIGTRPEMAEETMRECVELGIRHVWMHWGAGASSVSKPATEYGRKHGAHRDRRRLPVDVRPHRRSRAQDHAPRVRRARPETGVNQPPHRSCG